jgi:hypothetical protein
MEKKHRFWASLTFNVSKKSKNMNVNEILFHIAVKMKQLRMAADDKWKIKDW